MRIYDPRVGRFLSVDPIAKSYPFYTPYSFAGNKPITFIDRDGEEEGFEYALDRQQKGLTMGGKMTSEQIRDGQTARGMGALLGTAIVVDIFLTKGKLSQTLLYSELFSAFPHNQAKTPEGRTAQNKESVTHMFNAGIMYGTGEILGTAFKIASPLLRSAIEYTRFEGGTTFAEIQGESLGYYSYSNAKGLELDLDIPKNLQNKGLGTQIFKDALNTTNANKFTAKWITSSGYENGSSINLQTFYDALKKGSSEVDAAFSTWSGKQARAAGFNNVKVERIDNGIQATFTKK